MVDIANMQNRQKQIEIFLAKQPRNCANAHEIAMSLNIHWVTAERELNRMLEEGRVHTEVMGSSKIYFLNGKGKWQDRVKLSSNRTLFLDTFVSPFGEKFVRIKETRLKGDKWEATGNIIITRNKLEEFAEKLEQITKNIKAT